MNWLRELFAIEGWKKFFLTFLALIIGGAALFTDDLSGGEYVGLVGVLTAFFGAADVGSKWVRRGT